MGPGRMEPVCFDGHMGALHLPAEPRPAGKTIIVCAPLGAEARSAYRPLFLWARALCARGHVVLRYDHAGQGDSLPLDSNTDQWERWLLGMEQAARFAHTHVGGGELVFAGMRFGALIAAAAAERCAPAGLILLAPTVTGDCWLRELRWVQQLQTGKPCVGPGVAVSGLELSAATVKRIEPLDLRRMRVKAQRIFLAAPASTPDLSCLGPHLTSAGFPGYAQLFQEAHRNQTPKKVFDGACEWLQSWSGAGPGAVLPVREAQFVTRDWIERPVRFGSGLRGVVTTPLRPRSSRAVIFANTAGDPRAGVGSFAARACRALAEKGVAAMRFDFLGLGESPDHPGGRPHVYETKRTGEFLEASAALKALGYKDAVLAGVCTGGYHALRAVIETEEFRRAIAINAWLVWRPDRSLDFPEKTVSFHRRNIRALFSPSFWRAVIQGRVDLMGRAKGLAERARRILSSFQPDQACARTRKEIAAAISRGADIRLFFAHGDVALQGLESDFGWDGFWLRAHGAKVRLSAALDHALMRQEAQDVAVNEIMDFLQLPELANTAPAPTPDPIAAMPIAKAIEVGKP